MANKGISNQWQTMRKRKNNGYSKQIDSFYTNLIIIAFGFFPIIYILAQCPKYLQIVSFIGVVGLPFLFHSKYSFKTSNWMQCLWLLFFCPIIRFISNLLLLNLLSLCPNCSAMLTFEFDDLHCHLSQGYCFLRILSMIRVVFVCEAQNVGQHKQHCTYHFYWLTRFSFDHCLRVMADHCVLSVTSWSCFLFYLFEIFSAKV